MWKRGDSVIVFPPDGITDPYIVTVVEEGVSGYWTTSKGDIVHPEYCMNPRTVGDYIDEIVQANKLTKDLLRKIKRIIDNARLKPGDTVHYMRSMEDLHNLLLDTVVEIDEEMYENQEGSGGKSDDPF